MKVRILMLLLFMGMIAACKKDSTTPQKNKGGEDNISGQGLNTITLTIDGKTYTMKGSRNSLLDNSYIRCDIDTKYDGYGSRVGILVEGDEYPYNLDIVATVRPQTSSGIAQYDRMQSRFGFVDKNYIGGIIIDSGYVNITSVVPNNDLVAIKGDFHLWISYDNTSKKVTGTIDCSESMLE